MDEVMDETFGLGPLETLLKDPTITDILVNRFDRIYVERQGRLELADVRFRDNAASAADHRPHRRRWSAGASTKSARWSMRALPTAAASTRSSRRWRWMARRCRFAASVAKPLQLEDLIRHGAFPPAVMDFLAAAVQARCNVLISGGTGSGKTTLLNCLSRYIPADERVITIEDAAELQLQQPHVVRLETRPPNIEGKGEVTQRDLVKNCLRMRPDRIIIGEVRGGEALDMLQAMNTGHEGSMTTVHANTPRDALGRLEVMIAMAGFDIPDRGPCARRSPAPFNIIVQASRLPGGKRKVVARQRNHRHGRRADSDARPLRLRAAGRGRERPRVRVLPGTRHPPQSCRSDRAPRHCGCRRICLPVGILSRSNGCAERGPEEVISHGQPVRSHPLCGICRAVRLGHCLGDQGNHQCREAQASSNGSLARCRIAAHPAAATSCRCPSRATSKPAPASAMLSAGAPMESLHNMVIQA